MVPQRLFFSPWEKALVCWVQDYFCDCCPICSHYWNINGEYNRGWEEVGERSWCKERRVTHRGANCHLCCSKGWSPVMLCSVFLHQSNTLGFRGFLAISAHLETRLALNFLSAPGVQHHQTSLLLHQCKICYHRSRGKPRIMEICKHFLKSCKCLF